MKRYYLIKNMPLTQSLLIMVQINFPFVSMTKEMTLLSNLYIPIHLKPFQTKFKTPIKKEQKKPFINNLSYPMIPILQVMTKTIYTQELQNLTPHSYPIQHYNQKNILLSKSQLLTPHKNVFLQ